MTFTITAVGPQWCVVTPYTRWIGSRDEAEQRYAVLRGLGVEAVCGPWIAGRLWALGGES